MIGFATTLRVAGFTGLVGRFGAALARGLAVTFTAGRFATAFLVAVTFEALCARAFPAGERLVAGFSRGDLATRLLAVPDFVEARTVERDESLFSGLLILNRRQRKNCLTPPDSGRSLTQLLP